MDQVTDIQKSSFNQPVNLLRTFLIGGAMGVANIIPGVSGGTIAVVFGIYDNLMESLGNFLRASEKRWQYIRFLAALFLGSLITILAVAPFLKWSFENYPVPTVFFFIGLILGSIPVVYTSYPDMKLSPGRALAFLAGMALVVVLALIQHDSNGAVAEITVPGLAESLYYLLCGAIAASAMIVPGVSGSFILILLGVYWNVLNALSGIFRLLLEQGFGGEVLARLQILGMLGIGVVIGILGFSRLMDWALKKNPSLTMYAILGLIIGSLYQIYPGFAFNMRGLGAALTFAVGLIISLKFGKEH
jgi:putative membrane protein